MWLEGSLAVLSALFAGLLAGEEFVICYGVRAPLAALEAQPSILLRQALIRRLRILVPALFGLASVSGVAAAVAGGAGGPAFVARCAGLLCLLVFIAVTLAGTVPINQAALSWAPASPPEGWRAAIRRWERLDNVRTWAAIGAFVMFVAASGVK